MYDNEHTNEFYDWLSDGVDCIPEEIIDEYAKYNSEDDAKEIYALLNQ
jgi:hypothetical protein